MADPNQCTCKCIQCSIVGYFAMAVGARLVHHTAGATYRDEPKIASPLYVPQSPRFVKQ